MIESTSASITFINITIYLYNCVHASVIQLLNSPLYLGSQHIILVIEAGLVYNYKVYGLVIILSMIRKNVSIVVSYILINQIKNI